MINPWAGMIVVAAAFLLLMQLALRMRRAGRAGPEGSRKLMHVGMGLVTASFPWLFRDEWPVIVLSGGFVLLLIAFRMVPPLKARIGHVLNDVKRISMGEIYFPIMVGFLFIVSDGVWTEFVIPVLVLTLADAAAALVGMRFGKLHYLADEGTKSWEGSLVFIAVAWLCVTLPLSMHGIDPAAAALTGVCIASAAMLLEASAWRGLDNLFIPVAALLMTRFFTGMQLTGLLQNVAILGVLTAVHFGCRKRALLREGTLMGLLVLIYLHWALAGWRWAIGPLILLSAVPLIAKGKPQETELPVHCHQALIALPGITLVWLVVEKLGHQSGFTGFSMVLAAHTAMICGSLWRTDLRRSVPLALLGGVIGWACMMAPWWTAGEISTFHLWSALASVIAATLMFHMLRPRISDTPWQHWTCRGTLALCASLPATLQP